VLHISLDLSIIETTTDQTLGIKDSVVRVHGDLVLGGITNKTLRVSETNIRGGGTVTLIVGNDFDTIVLPDTNTRVATFIVKTRTITFGFLITYVVPKSIPTMVIKKKTNKQHAPCKTISHKTYQTFQTFL
jgi:hypothetical protein